MKNSEPVEKAMALATRIRANALRMVHRARASHIGGCLSAADLLAHLYGYWLNVDPANPERPGRDRFIMSKGHAAAALYATLAERGFFEKELLETYSQDGSVLAGHVTHKNVPGVEVSTGSLGHGLPIGCGMALALKHDGFSARVAVLLSDGECDEGSTWEAALFAGHHGLDNLLVIVDHNKLQALGRVDEVMNLHPFADKWSAFNWNVREIDGHDHRDIHECLRDVPFKNGRPSVIIAHTVKGKGVSFMENQLAWHYKSPNEKELEQAISEIAE